MQNLEQVQEKKIRCFRKKVWDYKHLSSIICIPQKNDTVNTETFQSFDSLEYVQSKLDAT